MTEAQEACYKNLKIDGPLKGLYTHRDPSLTPEGSVYIHATRSLQEKWEIVGILDRNGLYIPINL